MSLRQMKKIVNKEHKEIEEKEEDYDEEDEKPITKNKFLDLSDQSSSEEEVKEPIQEKPKPMKKAKKTKAKAKSIKEPQMNFDELITELTKSSHLPEAQKKVQKIPCLKRSSKHFDSSYELQKLFHEKTKAKSTSHQKSFILTPTLQKLNIKINYLPNMELKTTKFSFEMSKGYLKIYGEYLNCVESSDPGLLHEFSNRFPFHIESLFQLAQFFKIQAKYEQVFSILERILFTYQLSFHHQFSPIGKHVAIDKNETNLNKIFFLSLFMHIDCLGRKGCYRTALEFTKFLLCLDYTDPLGCLLLIDFYSISTKKYDYFISFCEDFMMEYYGFDKTLTIPSILYSLALCKALACGSFEINDQDVNRAFSINSLNSISKENANVILLVAVATFPVLAKNLLEKLAPGFCFDVETNENVYDYTALATIYSARNLEH